MGRLKMETKTKTIVGTVVIPDPVDIRIESKTLIEDIHKNWYRLSKNLAIIYDSDLWKSWKDGIKDFASFRQYVERELNIDYRIAMWRVQMGRAILKYNISEEQINNIGGWTKFKEWTALLSLDMPQADLFKVLEAIKSKTFAETRDYIEKIKTELRGGQEVQRVTLTFQLIAEEAEVVKTTLREVMRLIDTENESTALSYMALDYGANHAEKVNTAVEELVKKYQEARKKNKQPHKEHANKGKAKKEGGKEDGNRKKSSHRK